MVADEVVETPYAVCKTAVLTVELIGNSKYTNHCVRNRIRGVVFIRRAKQPSTKSFFRRFAEAMPLYRKTPFVAGQHVQRLVFQHPFADGADQPAAVADPVEARRRVPSAEKIGVVVKQVVLVRHLALVVVPRVKPAEMELHDMPLVLVPLDVDVVLAVYRKDMIDRRIVPPAAPLGPAPVLDHVMALAPQEPVLVVAPERMREVAQLLKLGPRIEARVDQAPVLLDRVEEPVDRYVRDHVCPFVDWNVILRFHTVFLSIGCRGRIRTCEYECW